MRILITGEFQANFDWKNSNDEILKHFVPFKFSKRPKEQVLREGEIRARLEEEEGGYERMREVVREKRS